MKWPEPVPQVLTTPAPDPASVRNWTLHDVEILIPDNGRIGSTFISSEKDVVLSPGTDVFLTVRNLGP